jgi:hypothetical protein
MSAAIARSSSERDDLAGWFAANWFFCQSVKKPGFAQYSLMVRPTTDKKIAAPQKPGRDKFHNLALR